MAATTEIEIKLACGAHHVQALLKHPVLAHPAPGTAPTRDRLLNLYFDTDDLDLRRRRLALRLRRYGFRWLQTLKASGERSADRRDGIAVRREWEMPVAGPQLEFAKLRDTPLRDALAEIGPAERIRPIFRVEFVREAWTVKPFPRYAPDFVAEIAFDHGRIFSGERTERISEIELELKSGHVRELEYLAHVLMRDLKIKEEPRSKAKRGYAMLQAAAERATA
ncbi:MAG: CYTH domain-containing protein [Burkholderiales bacterium]|nr:CYTH domain-containing protein [Burkholderiales bacterium]